MMCAVQEATYTTVYAINNMHGDGTYKQTLTLKIVHQSTKDSTGNLNIYSQSFYLQFLHIF